MEAALDVAERWVTDGRVPAVAAYSCARAGSSPSATPGCASAEPTAVARTLFALASLTKPMVAAACLVAVEERL